MCNWLTQDRFRTSYKSVIAVLKEEAKIRDASSRHGALLTTDEEDATDWKQRFELNDKWNAEISLIRNDRLEKLAKDRADNALRIMEEKEYQQEESREIIQELVRAEKEAAKTFIKRENIEEAIDYALANPTNFNFAIDISRNIRFGAATTEKIEELDGQS